ncbi:MAG: hypothetical protein FWD49_04600 [Firmicutes bacterium]|nr:hypothetical protein [Bacillota bacterium]
MIEKEFAQKIYCLSRQIKSTDENINVPLLCDRLVRHFNEQELRILKERISGKTFNSIDKEFGYPPNRSEYLFNYHIRRKLCRRVFWKGLAPSAMDEWNKSLPGIKERLQKGEEVPIKELVLRDNYNYYLFWKRLGCKTINDLQNLSEEQLTKIQKLKQETRKEVSYRLSDLGYPTWICINP